MKPIKPVKLTLKRCANPLMKTNLSCTEVAEYP